MKPHVLFPKLLLEDDAYALSVERVASEISVVCLVVSLEVGVAVVAQSPSHVEVADERRILL